MKLSFIWHRSSKSLGDYKSKLWRNLNGMFKAFMIFSEFKWKRNDPHSYAFHVKEKKDNMNRSKKKLFLTSKVSCVWLLKIYGSQIFPRHPVLCLRQKFAPFCTHILFSPLANGNIHDRNWTLRPSTNQRNVSATKRGEFLQQSWPEYANFEASVVGIHPSRLASAKGPFRPLLARLS